MRAAVITLSLQYLLLAADRVRYAPLGFLPLPRKTSFSSNHAGHAAGNTPQPARRLTNRWIFQLFTERG